MRMKTSWNGNIFRVTGPLWGKFPDHQWIPLTKASDAELCLMFSLNCAWRNGLANNRNEGDLRRHRAHYDVTLMACEITTIYYLWLPSQRFGCQLDEPYGFPGDHQPDATMLWCTYWYLPWISVIVLSLCSVGNKTYYYYYSSHTDELLSHSDDIVVSYGWVSKSNV